MRKLLLFATIGLMAASCVHGPQRSYPTPSRQQLEWQQLETYAFIHFGLNTFNDMEWGYGNMPASTFNPQQIDCEQWVLTLKNCGMKGVILTAKHHDGFCLWPTETTDYSIKNSPYKEGHGDLVRELSDACRKHGLKFGIYLSPWDRHQTEYGREGYVKIYHQQIEELTSNYGDLFEFWFDGANGGDGWYGGANETRSIVAEEYYDYEKAREIVWSHSPDAAIFGGTVPTLRWIGNEEGRADATLWSNYHPDFKSLNNTKTLSRGFVDGEAWLPAEVDVSIRPGWFYHESQDDQVKTVEQLTEIYYNSVGHNANLLLNFPVNKAGKIPSTDSLMAVQWYRSLQKEFSDNLLKHSKVTSSSMRSWRFSPKQVLDEEYTRYWATEDGVRNAELVFEFSQPTTLSHLMLQEYIPLGQNVEHFTLDRYINGKWLPIEIGEELTTIGYKRLLRFDPVEMERLRIRFRVAKGTLCLTRVVGA